MAIYQGDKLLASDINVKPGTTNYNDLSNKPSVNGIALEGNKTATDLSLQSYIPLPDNTDLNTITENGLYTIDVSPNSVDITHIPLDAGDTVWFIEVHSQKESSTRMAIWQYAHAMIPHTSNDNKSGNNIYARTCNSFNETETMQWSEWYQIAGSGLDLPSNKSVDITLQASGTTYTAPANGYFTLLGTGTPPQFCRLYNPENPVLGISLALTQQGIASNCILPVSKNDKIQLDYNATVEAFHFVYANSEVPMNERFPASTTVNEEPIVAKVTSTKKTRSKKTSS